MLCDADMIGSGLRFGGAGTHEELKKLKGSRWLLDQSVIESYKPAVTVLTISGTFPHLVDAVTLLAEKLIYSKF